MSAIDAIMADFKTDPYLHQLKEFETSCNMTERAFLWQMRTGKTKITIDTACHMFKKGMIDAVIVIAPNGVHENWTRRELPTHHWDTCPYDTLVWRTDACGERGIDRVRALERRGWIETHDAWWERSKRLLSRGERLAWFSFNSESMTRADVRKLIAKVAKKKRFLLVVDESHDFRTPGSKRTSMIRAFAKRAVARRILTGTVVSNSPLHAWAQFEILTPGALGYSKYSEFKTHYAEYKTETTRAGRKYPKLVGYRNLDELTETIAKWSSVVLRSDCEDLPELIRTPRSIQPTDEQRRIYKELHSSFEVEVGDELVSIGEDSQKLVKLQQVMSGYLLDEFGDRYVVPGVNPRLEAMSDEVYLSSGKVIIWCRFRQDIDWVCERLREDGHKVVEYHGRVSSENKNKSIDAFRDDEEVKVLVGYPFGGHNLASADTILNYSHTFDAILREQSDERATEVGGANVSVVDFVMLGPDQYILDNLAEKVHIADAVGRDGLKEVLRRIAI